MSGKTIESMLAELSGKTWWCAVQSPYGGVEWEVSFRVSQHALALSFSAHTLHEALARALAGLPGAQRREASYNKAIEDWRSQRPTEPSPATPAPKKKILKRK